MMSVLNKSVAQTRNKTDILKNNVANNNNETIIFVKAKSASFADEYYEKLAFELIEETNKNKDKNLELAHKLLSNEKK